MQADFESFSDRPRVSKTKTVHFFFKIEPKLPY